MHIISSDGFTVNGVPATIFNPHQQQGNYTAGVTRQRRFAKAFGPNDPGCIQAVFSGGRCLPVPAITKQPRDIGLCIGAADHLSLTATVAAPSTLAYQWQQQINGTWVNIPGATSSTLPIINVTAGDNNERYRCIVTALNANGFGCPIFSDVVTLHVHETIPMTCVGHINFSLDANCEATNFVDIFLNGTS
ncbi:MAG: hypothetical protein IPO92_12880 [Saprospiraceae bacterium]|nr:hypothetical protein [Saprospiraceae bacterium]